MAHAFRCLHCGQLVTTEVAVGARIACPSCRRENVVPADARPTGAVPVPAPGQEPAAAGAAEGRPYVNNHLAKAILATIFCCLPLGIVAIVKAAQVNSRLEIGDLERAEKFAGEANSWANWSIVVGLLGAVLYGLMTIGMTFLQSMGS
jgi:phage FluMu protein Com